MITFITGRAGSGKSEEILRRIAAALEAGHKRLILLVPEQQAVVWESRIARRLPASAALNLEIVNFKRLCNLVRRTYGGMNLTAATAGGKSAILWSVLNSMKADLTCLGSERRPDRAVAPMLSAVEELKRCGVSTDTLSDTGLRLQSGAGVANRAGTRAWELARVTAAYNQALSEHFEEDNEDLLLQLLSTLREHPFFEGADLFVDSFFSVTRTESDILRLALRQAENVCMTFLLDRGQGREMEAQFRPALRFYAEMVEAAPDYETVRLTENHRAGTPALAYLEQNLWKGSVPAYGGEDDGSVNAYSVSDRYDEAECVACTVEKLVQNGAKYGDIAVIARNAEALAGILDMTFTRHRIPYYVSERENVTAHPAARLIFSALSVCGKWHREDLIRCAKTGLCGLTAEECDALDTYTATWGIIGRFNFAFAWVDKPNGYTNQEDRRPQILVQANAAREKLYGPLDRFTEVFGDTNLPTVRAAATAVYNLLEDFRVADVLDENTERYRREKRYNEAAREAQMWKILMDALDELVDALADDRVDAPAFSALLRRVLCETEVGTIPSGVDNVVIGSANQVRLGEIDHIIAVGVTEGEFPAAPKDDGYFSDAEKDILKAEGITLSANTAERMEEELLWFYRTVSLPHKSLTLFVPEMNGTATAYPSFGADRIFTLFPRLRRAEEDKRPAPMPAADRFRTADAIRRNARKTTGADWELFEELGVLAAGGEQFLISVTAEEKLDPETAQLLYPRDIYLTQTKLDRYIECPFKYTAEFLLHLAEEKSAVMTAVNIGSFIHSIFELFFNAIDRDKLNYPLTEETLNAISDEAIRQTTEEFCPNAKKRTEYLIRRLRHCVMPVLRQLNEEFAHSDFRPIACEEKIGDFDAKAEGKRYLPHWRIPLPDGEHGVSIGGTIDRLDVFRVGNETFVRVVDYKTGSKDFREQDIAIGINTQLYLYLFTLLECPEGDYREWLTGSPSGVTRAAGMFYYPLQTDKASSKRYLPRRHADTSQEAEKLVRKEIKTQGLVLADPKIIDAMEHTEGGKYRYIPTKKEKVCAKTQAEFEVLRETLQNTLSDTAQKMVEGLCGAVPRKDEKNIYPCQYCHMAPLCRAAKKSKKFQ